MKLILKAFCTFLMFGGLVSAQTESSELNQSKNTEIGVIRDLHVSLLKSNSLSGNNSQELVRISYLPKKAKVSNMYAVFADTLELAHFIESLKTLSLNADSVNENDLNNPDLSFMSENGMEAHCYLTYEKTQALAGSGQAGTKEKMYVETEDRMYEGMTVYTDVNGTFVWKTVVLTPETNKTKDGFLVRGTKTFSIQLQKNVGASKMKLSSFEFKELITLLETAKTRMNS